MARVEVDVRRAYVPSMFLPLVESSALQQLLSREVARAAHPIVHLIEHEVVRPLRSCKGADALERLLRRQLPLLRDYVLALGFVIARDLAATPDEAARRLDDALGNLTDEMEAAGDRLADKTLADLLLALSTARRAFWLALAHPEPPDEVLEDFLRFILVLLAIQHETRVAPLALLSAQARESALSMMRRLKAARVRPRRTRPARVESAPEDLQFSVAAFRSWLQATDQLRGASAR